MSGFRRKFKMNAADYHRQESLVSRNWLTRLLSIVYNVYKEPYYDVEWGDDRCLLP